MKALIMSLLGATALHVCLFGQTPADSVAAEWSRQFELDEFVVVAERTVLKQTPDRIVYLTKNDPYALGLNAIQLLDRIPRVMVANDRVSVAGKASVRYIVDGHLLELTEEALALRLKNIQASGIEKIELLTTPPPRYAAAGNVAYISITTRNDALGTRGNVWGNGALKDDFNYLLGGNLCHTTRKIEISADASWQDIKGINDLDRTYTLADYIRTSIRSNRFTNRSLAANGLFKYKFGSKLSAGVIVNFNTIRLKSLVYDVAVDNGVPSFSSAVSPARPDNALTLTAFADCLLDAEGKTLSITYNMFDRHTHSYSDVDTRYDDGAHTSLTDAGTAVYCIHSVKADAALPFSSFRMDAGAAYTTIGNNTGLSVSGGDPSGVQSNSFRYDEKTAAIYVGAEKNFSDAFFGKVSLRYEHTELTGCQSAGSLRNSNRYGHIFPTVNLSWNTPKAGRFTVSYVMGISRPAFGDLNPFRYYTTVSDYYSGNPDLKLGITHNAELNWSFKGIYAVVYTSHNRDAVGYVTRFNHDGSRVTLPENCLDAGKSGLYAAYSRSVLPRWNVNVGGEVFYTYAKSKIADFRDAGTHDWSGKVDVSTSWMLNRAKTLIFNVRFCHYFPSKDRMVRYDAHSLVSADLRYSLLAGRLSLALSVNDPFGWNIVRSRAYYKDYMLYTRNDIHSRAFSLNISWNFGRNSVNRVFRDSRERESARAR